MANRKCRNCGMSVSDIAVFCPNCGSPIGESEPQKRINPIEGNAGIISRYDTNQREEAPKKTKRSLNPLMIAGGAAGALLVSILGIGIAAVGGKKIDLDDYLQFQATGYDTVGRAECYFDRMAYENDVYEILDKKGIWDSEPGSKKAELAEDLLSAFYEPVLDKDSGLSNGDKVEVTTEYDASKYKKLGVKLTGGKKTFEVAELAPVQDFDPFSSLQVTFGGVSPMCTAALDGMTDGLTYTASQDAGLAIGDTVTVSVSYNGGQDFSEFTADTGLKVTATEKTYEVKDMPHYPESLSDIPDDMKSKMDKVARESIAQMQSTEWKNDFELLGADFVGYYYRTPKKINLYQESDYRLYMVYKIKVATSAGSNYEFYNYWCFKNMEILPNGTCTCDLSDYEVGGEKHNIWDQFPREVNSSWSYYRGFNTTDAIFNQEIAKYTDLYDYESTVTDGNAQSVTGEAAEAEQ